MIQRLRHYLAGSLRRRLLVLTLAPLLLLLLALVGLTAYWTTAYTDRQLYMNVRSDLDVASRTLQRQHQRLRDGLETLRRNLRQSTTLPGSSSPSTETLAPRLKALRETLNADWLRWLPAEQLGQTPGVAALVPRLRQGESLDGLDMLSADSLASLDPLLAERARLALRRTPMHNPARGVRKRAACCCVRWCRSWMHAGRSWACLMPGGCSIVTPTWWMRSAISSTARGRCRWMAQAPSPCFWTMSELPPT
ncbi:hypothetical protein ACU8V3_00495 [Cobetia marina]